MQRVADRPPFCFQQVRYIERETGVKTAGTPSRILAGRVQVSGPRLPGLYRLVSFFPLTQRGNELRGRRAQIQFHDAKLFGARSRASTPALLQVRQRSTSESFSSPILLQMKSPRFARAVWFASCFVCGPLTLDRLKVRRCCLVWCEVHPIARSPEVPCRVSVAIAHLPDSVMNGPNLCFSRCFLRAAPSSHSCPPNLFRG